MQVLLIKFLLLNLFLSFFDAIVNGIIFLISFSGCFLLVRSNKVEFCILIFYSVTLLNLVIS